MDYLKQISDAISAFLGLIGGFLFGFVLLMGMFHKTGKTVWLKRERKRRVLQGKPNLNLLSDEKATDFPWKDPDLVQGGFTALKVTGILATYLVIFPLFEPDMIPTKITPDTIAASAGFFMSMPISIGAVMVMLLAGLNIFEYKLPKAPFIPLFVINFLISESFIFILQLRSPQLIVGLQVILFLVISCYLSYLFGMRDGIYEADIEVRFPLVTVLTVQGSTLNQLRLYEKTETDYRFISDDGVDLILPSLHIVQIKYVPEKILGAELQSSNNKPWYSYDWYELYEELFKKHSPTKRAPDAGDSAASQAVSKPKKNPAPKQSQRPPQRR